MMAIPWNSIRSLLIFFGPFFLPKAIAYYRSVRHPPPANAHFAIQPIPPRIRPALALLAILAISFLVWTLPVFSPDNIFVTTQSRLQIPVDVLFNRLAALRPGFQLSPTDEALRLKFVNLESRLLYLRFGPDVVAGCPFCQADEPRSYFYYAVPGVLWPHLVNLIAVATVTSPAWTGHHGGRWRSIAVMVAGFVAALDVYLLDAIDHQANSRALRLNDVQTFFWTQRIGRLIALAAIDAILALVLYLSATNRAFARPPPPADRVDDITQRIQAAKSKMTALTIVKNTALRDEALRARSHAYWAHEVRLTQEIMEDREVVDGLRDALDNRIDMTAIMRDARAYSQNLLQLHKGQ